MFYCTTDFPCTHIQKISTCNIGGRILEIKVMSQKYNDSHEYFPMPKKRMIQTEDSNREREDFDHSSGHENIAFAHAHILSSTFYHTHISSLRTYLITINLHDHS